MRDGRIRYFQIHEVIQYRRWVWERVEYVDKPYGGRETGTTRGHVFYTYTSEVGENLAHLTGICQPPPLQTIWYGPAFSTGTGGETSVSFGGRGLYSFLVQDAETVSFDTIPNCIRLSVFFEEQQGWNGNTFEPPAEPPGP